jgi:NADPH-dependent ferric siderophore reductase
LSIAAETELRLPDPRAALDHLAGHLAGHGIEPEPLGPGAAGFSFEGARIEIVAGPDRLRLRVTARSENLLYFMKEGTAAHLAEIDPAGAEALTWSDGVVTGRPANLHLLRLRRREEPYPGMIRLVLDGADAAALGRDGLHVKLLLPPPGRRPAWPRAASNGITRWPEGEDALHVRYFTIRHVDPASGCVAVDVLRHPGGAVSDWAAAAVPGEEIGLMGPGGGLAPLRRAPLLLAGDETALPAIARILEMQAQDAHGDVVVALPDGVAPEAYLPPTRFRLHVLDAARFDATVVDAVRALRGRGFTQAWFAGEHATAQTMRAVFRGEFGLGKGAQFSASYWRRGVAGDARGEAD